MAEKVNKTSTTVSEVTINKKVPTKEEQPSKDRSPFEPYQMTANHLDTVGLVPFASDTGKGTAEFTDDSSSLLSYEDDESADSSSLSGLSGSRSSSSLWYRGLRVIH